MATHVHQFACFDYNGNLTCPHSRVLAATAKVKEDVAKLDRRRMGAFFWPAELQPEVDRLWRLESKLGHARGKLAQPYKSQAHIDKQAAIARMRVREGQEMRDAKVKYRVNGWEIVKVDLGPGVLTRHITWAVRHPVTKEEVYRKAGTGGLGRCKEVASEGAPG